MGTTIQSNRHTLHRNPRSRPACHIPLALTRLSRQAIFNHPETFIPRHTLRARLPCLHACPMLLSLGMRSLRASPVHPNRRRRLSLLSLLIQLPPHKRRVPPNLRPPNLLITSSPRPPLTLPDRHPVRSKRSKVTHTSKVAHTTKVMHITKVAMATVWISSPELSTLSVSSFRPSLVLTKV